MPVWLTRWTMVRHKFKKKVETFGELSSSYKHMLGAGVVLRISHQENGRDGKAPHTHTFLLGSKRLNS